MGNSYERFRGNVDELNEKCSTAAFVETVGVVLRFKVKSRTRISFLLPITFRLGGFVEIKAIKVDPATREVIPGSKKKLTIDEFTYVYQLLRVLIPNMSPSLIHRASDPSIENVYVGICSICLDRKTELVLPCLVCPMQHAFCELCIEQWCVRDKSCPACRMMIRSLTSESFMLVSQTEAETNAAMQEGVKEVLGLLEAKQ